VRRLTVRAQTSMRRGWIVRIGQLQPRLCLQSIALLDQHTVFVVDGAEVLDRNGEGTGPQWRKGCHAPVILARVVVD